MKSLASIVAVLCAIATCAVAAPTVPTFVVVCDDAQLCNQTKATIQYANQVAYSAYALNSTDYGAPVVLELRLASTGASAIVQLTNFAAGVSSPSFWFVQVASQAVSIELSRLQLPFVDFWDPNRAVEPTELRVSIRPSLHLEAAAAVLRTFNWNSTILFNSPQRTTETATFRAIASSTGILIDVQEQISSLFPSTVPQILSRTLASRSNVVVLLAGIDELALLASSSIDVYDFQVVWIPIDVVSQEQVQKTAMLGKSFRGIFTVQSDLEFTSILSALKSRNATLFPNSEFPSSLPEVFDATVSWIKFMTSSSNSSNNANIIAELRASEEVQGLATGLIHFNMDGLRVGDLSIVNHIFNSSTKSVVAHFHGAESPTVPSELEFVVPSNTLTFARGQTGVPSSTHLPIFLVAFIWDTLFEDTSSWLDAARMAEELINEERLIPGWDFRAVFYDDQLTAAGTIAGAVAVSQQNVRAVIAGTSSSQATAGMYYLAAQNIPMISGAATSDTLSDKTNFPTFMRTVAPDRFQGQVLSDLVNFFGWEKVCALNYQDEYGSNIISRFLGGFTRFNNVTVVRATYAASAADFIEPIKVLADAKCRIIVAAVAVGPAFGGIWKEAKKQGLLGPGIQWILADLAFSEVSQGSDYIRATHNLDPQDLSGVIVVAPLAAAASQKYATFRSGFFERTGFYPFDAYIAYWYDAVWTTAHAARNLLLSSPSNPSQLFNRTAYFEALQNTRFEGITGSVAFDESGDRLNMPYGIYNFVPSRNRDSNLYVVGTWQGSIRLNSSSIVFADGTNNIPMDELELPTTPFLYSWAGPAIITAFTALALAFVVITTIMVLIKKDNKLIFRSSPLFPIIIALGLCLGLMSVFFWFGEASVVKCHFRLWFGFVGFALAYGAMLAKNARLWYLFNEPSLRVIAITNRQLLTYLLLLVSPQLIILVLWSSLEAHQISPVLNGSGTARYLVCASQNTRIFAPISFAYALLLLVVGGILSFKTRTLPDIFRESNWIALSTYQYIFTATVCLVISYAITSEPTVGVVITCVGILFAATMNWALVFLPKFWIIFFKPSLIEEWSSGKSRSKRTDSGGSHPSKRQNTAAATRGSSAPSSYSLKSTAGTTRDDESDESSEAKESSSSSEEMPSSSEEASSTNSSS